MAFTQSIGHTACMNVRERDEEKEGRWNNSWGVEEGHYRDIGRKIRGGMCVC